MGKAGKRLSRGEYRGIEINVISTDMTFSNENVYRSQILVRTRFFKMSKSNM